MSTEKARLERELGLQGQAPAICPTIDRLSHSVTGRPPFSSFFSFEEIVQALAKKRARAMGKRREAAFWCAHGIGEERPEESFPCASDQYLPPRRAWKRPAEKTRKGCSPEKIAELAIVRTVLGFRKAGKLANTPWGRRLMALVEAVQHRVEAGEFALQSPRLLLKPKAAGKYRCLASYENLEDKLILSGTSNYLRMLFDPLLSEHCHSFRLNLQVSFQSAVRELMAYRQKHAGETLYAAECDIQKFFDTVDHREALIAFDHFAAKCGGEVDARARKVVEAYLASYDFDGALAKAGRGSLGERPLPVDRVQKVSSEVLGELHQGENLDELRLGLPQGGALSPVFANILLAEADRAVVGADEDPNLLYVRFCDDMVIVHTDRARCEAAMKRYETAVTQRKLPLHSAQPGGFVHGSKYYEAKTKGVFAWREAKKGEQNAASWVSFLGYQVDTNGQLRVRKDTVKKHILSLKKERREFDRRTHSLKMIDPRLEHHFGHRLMAKGVGFLRAGRIDENALCWAAAFENLNGHASASCELQMRRLDAVRDRLMASARKAFKAKPVGYRYFGKPFSYLGFLLRKARPQTSVKGKGRSLLSDLIIYGQI